VAQLKVRYLTGETEESRKNLSRDSQFQGRNLNRDVPDMKQEHWPLDCDSSVLKD
jgi:hypothetical protein